MKLMKLMKLNKLSRSTTNNTKSNTLNKNSMATIAQKLTELVGNTPLLQLNAFSAKEELQTNIIAKVEYFNPAGSVKDRIALAMV